MKTDGKVVYPQFRKPATLEVPVKVTSELLHHDERIMLSRVTLRIGSVETVKHFLAHRKSEGLEIISVDA